MRLIKYIQITFQISRRNIVDLINHKKIFLNNKIIESYGTEVLENDILKFSYQGLNYKKIIKLKKNIDTKLVLFNKPINYVVSKSDPYNKTIYTILPKKLQSFYYIGRLDKNSHGLLLLTNNPKLVNQFEHPSYEIEKIYIVKLNKILEHFDIKKILKGVYDDGILLLVKSCKILSNNNIEITLIEGKKRHIRRIFSVLNYKVIDLQRIQEGKYKLNNLKKGEWKFIENFKFYDNEK